MAQFLIDRKIFHASFDQEGWRMERHCVCGECTEHRKHKKCLPVKRDPLTAYLSELSKYPVLSLKEEREINNQLIEANEDENKELNRHLETKDQEILALCKKIKEHEETNEEN